MTDRRLFSQACERNREPIREVLASALPAEGTLLEIASGTGMHAVYLSRALPAWTWQPSDADPEALASIEAWREAEGAANLRPPVRIDVTEDDWPVGSVDAVFNANMIHISPYASAEGLMRGVGRGLRAGGRLALYGPFKIDGAHTAESNARFDESLRARDPRWGVRDLEAIVALADAAGLDHDGRVEMPANNLTLLFTRR